MINRKWFLSGLIVINVMLSIVVIGDWRSREIAQNQSVLSKDSEKNGLEIQLFRPTSQRDLERSAESSIPKPDLLGSVNSRLNARGTKSSLLRTLDQEALEDGSSVNCLAFGPFRAAQLEQLQTTTDTLGIIRWVETLAKGSDGASSTSLGAYRVFVPPRDSLEEAYNLLQVFRAQGVDSYVMTQGIHAKGISLGVFSSELSVQSLIDQLGQTLRGYAEVVDVSPMQGDFMLQASAQTASQGTVQWVQAQAADLLLPPTDAQPQAYRVYVPPRENLEKAYALREVFRKQGFESYVMTQGYQAGGISLGVFSSDEAAQSLLDQLNPKLRALAKIGDASSGQSHFMLRASLLTAPQLSLLQSVFPDGIDPRGKVCSGPTKD